MNDDSEIFVQDTILIPLTADTYLNNEVGYHMSLLSMVDPENENSYCLSTNTTTFSLLRANVVSYLICYK